MLTPKIDPNMRWAGLFPPIPGPGDPPDISFSLFERISVENRVQLARAMVSYQKAVVKAQLDLLETFEGLAK
jgi:hypothetical protein